MDGDQIEWGTLRLASELVRELLDALPADGPRDIALRKAVEQRGSALDDLSDFEADRRIDPRR